MCRGSHTTPCRYGASVNRSTPSARWSSGQDSGLSRRKREFDSPTGHHRVLLKTDIADDMPACNHHRVVSNNLSGSLTPADSQQVCRSVALGPRPTGGYRTRRIPCALHPQKQAAYTRRNLSGHLAAHTPLSVTEDAANRAIPLPYMRYEPCGGGSLAVTKSAQAFGCTGYAVDALTDCPALSVPGRGACRSVL